MTKKFPIENFGWKKIANIVLSDGRRAHSFEKDDVEIVFIQGSKLDLQGLEQLVNIQDDSFVEALKQTQELINDTKR